MLKFIKLLERRYQYFIDKPKLENSKRVLFKQRVEQIIFAEAFIKKSKLLKSYPDTPLQIAVIGPTQTGKSSITNLILNSKIADVSPLAGHTVHPQGFCYSSKILENSGLQNYFGRFQQLTLNQLSKNRYDCYALTNNNPDTSLLPKCVFWDTPDFDSIDSDDYKEGVIKTIVLADIIILVVSKEKYADQTVWEMIKKIEPLHKPMLICINKLIEGTEDIIIDSIKEKWRHVRNDAVPDIVHLHYQKQIELLDWPISAKNVFFQLEKKVSKDNHHKYQEQLLNNYWHGWLEPIIAEHEEKKLWQILIDQNINQALVEYQRDYLNHPQHYDTFQKALVMLLDLLEIPWLSGTLSKARRVLTWPARKIIDLSKKKPLIPTNQEAFILNKIGEHLLISLTNKLSEKINHDGQENKWCTGIYGLLLEKRDNLLNQHKSAVETYCRSFKQDVKDAANRLYKKLSEHPVILNSLRVTRVTTDAVVLALAIKTGGVGIHDLVLTPAALSITSLLGEGVVGQYMSSVETELKQQQLHAVKHDLFIACLQQNLSKLPEQLKDISFNISKAQIIHAENQRKNHKHGIRIL